MGPLDDRHATSEVTVAFVTDTIGFPNGLAGSNRLRCVASALASAGANAEVLVMRPTEDASDVQNADAAGVLDPGVRFEYTSGTTTRSATFLRRRGDEIRGFVRAARRLREFARRPGGAVAYLWMNHWHWKGRAYWRAFSWVCRLQGVPCVAEINEPPRPVWQGNDGPQVERAQRRLLRGFDGAVVISDALWTLTAAARGAGRRFALLKVPVLVDVCEAAREGEMAEGPTVLFSGAPLYCRQMATFVTQAMRHVWRARPDARLVFCGWDGAATDPDVIGAMADVPAEAVTFAGRLSRKDLLRAYREASAIIMPLETEGRSLYRSPTKLPECLLSGRPVVTTNIGELPVLIRDRYNGVLAEPGDADAFGDAVLWALTSEDAAALGARGRQTASTLLCDAAHGPALRDFFERVAGRAGTARPAVAAAPRVLYLSYEFPTLTQTFVRREIEQLVERGLDVGVVSLRRPRPGTSDPGVGGLAERTVCAGPLAWYRLAASFAVACVVAPRAMLKCARIVMTSEVRPARKRASLAYHLLVANRLRSLGVVSGADYLHAPFATGPASLAMFLSILTGVPFGVTAHAYDLFAERIALAEKLQRASLFVTISDYNRRWLIQRYGHSAEKVEVVRCGVDAGGVPHEREALASPPLVLSVGSLVAKKGHETLLGACALLADSGVEHRCEIVGEGPLRAGLVDVIEAKGLSGVAVLRGGLPNADVARRMEQASVFVLACEEVANGDRDGIPVALMEAMVSGVPVVSTSVSGIPELIEDEVTGLLVQPGDPAALAAALSRVLEGGELSQRLARNARAKVVEDFSLDRNCRRLDELIRLTIRGPETHQGSGDNRAEQSAGT